jgi:hypothetical protein
VTTQAYRFSKTTPVLDGPCAGQNILDCPSPLPHPMLCRPHEHGLQHQYTLDRKRGGYTHHPDCPVESPGL